MPKLNKPAIILELQEAIKRLEPPFLGLPEHGFTVESMAYRKGLYDAYVIVLKVIKEAEGFEC
jgi:hypothetical protein